MSEDNPIKAALENVIGLFCSEEQEFHLLLPYDNEDIIMKILKEIKPLPKKRTPIIFFEHLEKDLDTWDSNTYHFWMGFFKKLGHRFVEGSDLVKLIHGLTGSELSDPEISTWHYNLYRHIETNFTYNINDTVSLIGNDKYSFARVSHNSTPEDGKDENILRLSYIVTALRESILWNFQAKDDFKILIIDDRLYELNTLKNGLKEKNKDYIKRLNNICKSLNITCYGIIKYNGLPFGEVIDNLVEGKTTGVYFKDVSKIIAAADHCEDGLTNLETFDYILVDLWYAYSKSIRGLKVISDLQHKFEEIARRGVLSFDKDKIKYTKIPEILAYSVSDDNETIQMAHRMGAAGYVNKEIPESFVLALVRAGAPLDIEDATRVDFLSTNSFPAINRVPRQITKSLYFREITCPNENSQMDIKSLDWLRKIPKSDLHVHFGTAIPLKWCYILSLISLIHWNDYWKVSRKDKKEFMAAVGDIVKKLKIIINGSLKDYNSKAYNGLEEDFRRVFLKQFSSTFKCSGVIFMKDVIAYLVSLSSQILTDKQVACIINVMLGNIVFSKKQWQDLYKGARERIIELQGDITGDSTEVSNEGKEKIHNLEIFRDCRYLIKGINLEDELSNDGIITLIYGGQWNDSKYYSESPNLSFDPLSELLSIGIPNENPYGLERYLASSVLVGSSILQFTDTLLLAAMSIPEWAAAQKSLNRSKETNEALSNKETDNVIHLELRTTPQGLLNPYELEQQDSSRAAKLICVGLEFGIKRLLKTPNPVSANLLLSIKRDRDRKEIGNLISIAVDLRKEYKDYLDENKKHLSEVDGFMIPHVAGLDVAGIERNNLPSELHPHYREAFERCLLSTIHAGETESARSVRDAIFLLNATRIGHGLSIKHDEELEAMISEKRICVELCPTSNQFTNGFPVSVVAEQSSRETVKKGFPCKEYVYNNFRGKLLLTINTDNPTISHRASQYRFAYPLSEEFIWLAGMMKINKKKMELNRLEVLYLIYNGFLAMFATEQAKKYIISHADDEVLSLLSKEYLDIDIEV